MKFSIDISLKKTTYSLLFVAIFLSLINVIVNIIIPEVFNSILILPRDFRLFFLLDHERNLPTWFTVMLLAANSLLLLLISLRTRVLKQKHFWFWLILGLIFFALSIDEFAGIHERLGAPIKELVTTSGLLTFAWIIPVGILVLVIGLAYLPFIFGLPRNIRNMFILAAVIYVGSAMGLESIGGLTWSTLTAANIQDIRMNSLYILLTTIEETLEMLGLVIFFYALGTYTYQQQLSEALDNASKQINDNTLNPSSDQQ